MINKEKEFDNTFNSLGFLLRSFENKNNSGEYSFNVFKSLKIDRHEEQISYVLRELLKFKNENNEYIFLVKFLEHLNFTDFNIGKEPKINIEASTENKRRIDLVIQGDNFIIAIENKFNEAIEQYEQLNDYYQDIIKQNKQYTKIIFMPQYWEKSLSASKIPTNDLTIMPFIPYAWSSKIENIEQNHESDSKPKDTLYLKKYSIYFWLELCKKEIQNERMRYFLLEFMEYIKNKAEYMDIEEQNLLIDYFESHKDNLKVACQTADNIKQLITRNKNKFIVKLYKQIKNILTTSNYLINEDYLETEIQEYTLSEVSIRNTKWKFVNKKWLAVILTIEDYSNMNIKFSCCGDVLAESRKKIQNKLSNIELKSSKNKGFFYECFIENQNFNPNNLQGTHFYFDFLVLNIDTNVKKVADYIVDIVKKIDEIS